MLAGWRKGLSWISTIGSIHRTKQLDAQQPNSLTMMDIMTTPNTASYLPLYGAEWKQARRIYLRSHPLCVDCQKQSRIVQATYLDHIKPHKGDLTLFWNQSNWQGLCHSCHSRKTAQQDGGYGNAPSNKPSKACGLDGIPTDSRHHWKG